MAYPNAPAVSTRPWVKNLKIPLEVGKCLEFVYKRVCNGSQRLDTHSERIVSITCRVDAQEKQNDIQGQLMSSFMKKIEEDMAQLKDSLETEKSRNTQLETLVQQLAQSNDKQPDAIMELKQRMDELSNQADGQKTIAVAKITKTNRQLRELDERLQRSERSSNMDSQKITDLEMDVERRFETAVIVAREDLRHHHDMVQSQANDHTETLLKTVRVLDSISQRVSVLEAAQNSHETATKTRQAATTLLEPLYERVKPVELASTAFQMNDSTHPTLGIIDSKLKNLRFDVDTLKSRSYTEIVASANFKKRLVALEKGSESVASTKIKETLTGLEEKGRDLVNRVQSTLANNLDEQKDLLANLANPRPEVEMTSVHPLVDSSNSIEQLQATHQKQVDLLPPQGTQQYRQGIPQFSTIAPVSFPIPPPVPPLFRHDAPRAVVTRQDIHQDHMFM
ncbi:hypothetical protein GT037_009992 [Alternaria burnsii]|uniref:Uncharacterized protein n=1 Tax=Alternaria burnsii TaxID=1187904 RepID=A0A8H7AZW9_9PLEO|nr:uncharacterized protein GT037_009992 [Alternaria burnsii]KAF7672093.1 hypothetical protein GT037_009992 [Alternaria burnsii]CAI9635778.1 unnamed protein product [Alternaria burnsii]